MIQWYLMLCFSPTQGARHHHAPSMMYLGKMFLHGQGFPIDYDMALLWFERAAKEVRLATFMKMGHAIPTIVGDAMGAPGRPCVLAILRRCVRQHVSSLWRSNAEVHERYR